MTTTRGPRPAVPPPATFSVRPHLDADVAITYYRGGVSSDIDLMLGATNLPLAGLTRVRSSWQIRIYKAPFLGACPTGLCRVPDHLYKHEPEHSRIAPIGTEHDIEAATRRALEWLLKHQAHGLGFPCPHPQVDLCTECASTDAILRTDVSRMISEPLPTTGVITFGSSPASRSTHFDLQGPGSAPEIQVPLLSAYVAHCHHTGQSVNPATYRTYLKALQTHAAPVERPEDHPDAYSDEGQRWQYLIAPTDTAEIDGTTALLKLQIERRDPEFVCWLPYQDFPSAEHLLREGATILRQQAHDRVRQLRRHYDRYAPDVSHRARYCTSLARRFDAVADQIIGAGASRDETSLAAMAQRQGLYADVLAEIRLTGMHDVGIDRISEGGLCLSFAIDEERALIARDVTGTLPGRREHLTGWHVELQRPDWTTPWVVYHASDPDHRPMIRAMSTAFERLATELTRARQRRANGGTRLCPACGAKVIDGRLDDEPCQHCIATGRPGSGPLHILR